MATREELIRERLRGTSTLPLAYRREIREANATASEMAWREDAAMRLKNQPKTGVFVGGERRYYQQGGGTGVPGQYSPGPGSKYAAPEARGAAEDRSVSFSRDGADYTAATPADAIRGIRVMNEQERRASGGIPGQIRQPIVVDPAARPLGLTPEQHAARLAKLSGQAAGMGGSVEARAGRAAAEQAKVDAEAKKVADAAAADLKHRRELELEGEPNRVKGQAELDLEAQRNKNAKELRAEAKMQAEAEMRARGEIVDSPEGQLKAERETNNNIRRDRAKAEAEGDQERLTAADQALYDAHTGKITGLTRELTLIDPNSKGADEARTTILRKLEDTMKELRADVGANRGDVPTEETPTQGQQDVGGVEDVDGVPGISEDEKRRDEVKRALANPELLEGTEKDILNAELKRLNILFGL